MSFSILFKFEIDNERNDMIICQWLIRLEHLEPLIEWVEVEKAAWLYSNIWLWLTTLKVFYWWKLLLRGDALLYVIVWFWLRNIP